jgi:hypothetical protein
LVVVLVLVSAPLFAHHGAASYDTNKLTTLKGVVTDFQFMNPHSEIFFDVTDAAGKVQGWIAEGVGVSTMSRGGWSKNILKAGDQITITGNPARNGSHAMRLKKIVLPNGRELALQSAEDYAGQ